MKLPHKRFRKRDWIWIGLIVLLVIVYHRPLSYHYDDPGEYFFTMSEHDVPSSRAELQDTQGPLSYDYTGDKLDAVKVIDNILGEDRNSANSAAHSEYFEYEPKYIVYSGREISHIYRDAIGELVAGSTGDEIQGAIDLLSYYIDGQDIYATSFFAADIVPQQVMLQSLYRVAPLYSVYLCELGKTEQCVDNFTILLAFAQQYKGSGSLIGMLIAEIEESLTLTYVEYLQATNPDSAQVVIEAWRTMDYADATDVLTEAFKGEYHMLQTELMNLRNISFIDMFGVEDDLRAQLAKGAMRLLPFELFVDRAETLKFARGYYKAMIDSLHDETLAVQYTEDLETLRGWPTPFWTRSNPVGYVMLQSVVPQLTGVSARMFRAQNRFEILIAQ